MGIYYRDEAPDFDGLLRRFHEERLRFLDNFFDHYLLDLGHGASNVSRKKLWCRNVSKLHGASLQEYYWNF